MADDNNDGSNDILAEIRKMEKEKEELEKRNLERQQQEQYLKQLKGSVASLKSGKSSQSSSQGKNAPGFALNPSMEESQTRLRVLQESILRSPRASTSFRDDDDTNTSFEEIEDDVMSPQHKQALRENRDVLVENMTPDDIFNDLISKHILSNADVSRIKEKNTVEAINEELLNVLIRRSEKAFTVFVSSLRRTLQGWLANRLDPDVTNRSKRKRRTGELNVDVECQRITPHPKKRYICTCREVEEQILVMSKVAFLHIRRRDGTSASFDQFKKELHQTNEAIKDSMEILHSLKVLCRHGDVSDLSEGSVRFTVRCSSFASCRRLWEDYKSGAILETFQKSIITPSLLKICGAKKIILRVRISELEYLTCALELGKELQRLHAPQRQMRDDEKRSRYRKAKLRRLCLHVKENSPGVQDKRLTSFTQNQRVLREISPNTLSPKGTSKTSYLRSDGDGVSSPCLSSQPYPSSFGCHRMYKESTANMHNLSHGTSFSEIDTNHHFIPRDSLDTCAWQSASNTHQESPVHKTRSKTSARHIKGGNYQKIQDVFFKDVAVKCSPYAGYNLRHRTIRS